MYSLLCQSDMQLVGQLSHLPNYVPACAPAIIYRRQSHSVSHHQGSWNRDIDHPRTFSFLDVWMPLKTVKRHMRSRFHCISVYVLQFFFSVILYKLRKLFEPEHSNVKFQTTKYVLWLHFVYYFFCTFFFDNSYKWPCNLFLFNLAASTYMQL